MKLVRAVGVLALSTFAFTACDVTTGLDIADLAGSWNAAAFIYNDDSGDFDFDFSINAIGEPVGGEITLDVAEDGSFTGTLMVPGLTQNPENEEETLTLDIGGTISLVSQDTLSVDFDQATESIPGEPLGDFEAVFSLIGDVLSFSFSTTFDFPDDLEQASTGTTRGEVPVVLSAEFHR